MARNDHVMIRKTNFKKCVYLPWYSTLIFISPFPLHSQTYVAAWRRSHHRDGLDGSMRRDGFRLRRCYFGAITHGAPAIAFM